VVALACFGLMALAGVAWAQPARSGAAPESQVSGSKYYVWGQVRAPGAYSFVASPDIVELLSAGGGPTEYANLRRVILIRAVTQKRTRIDLQKMMDSGQVARLAPGDVVIVPSSPWYNVRDWFTGVTMATTLVTLAITILSWARK
jgi:protein involved in polysaccharide export with SLBB domain